MTTPQRRIRFPGIGRVWWPACLLLLASCRAGVPADAPPVPAFPPHPRYTLTPRELQAWRADPAREKERQRLRRRAEALLEKGLTVPRGEGGWVFKYACPDDGKRLRAESMEVHVCPACGQRYTDETTIAAYRTVLYNRLEREMHTLARAYALTGKERYAAPVREAFLELAEVYPTLTRHDIYGRRGLLAVVGGRRYGQALDEACGAITLAKAYDLLAAGSVLSAEDRRIIADDFLNATVREVMDYQFFVSQGGRSNHQTWFNAAYAAVGLATGREDLLQAAVYGDRGLLYQLEASVTDDGLWYEGTLAYHFYALSAVQETLDAVRRIGWTFADDERLKSLWLAPLQLAYPNGQVPAINDSDRGHIGGRKGYYRWAAEYFDDPALAQMLGEAGGEQPPSAVLADAGLVTLRRGEGSDAVCAILDFGPHGGYHGHPDKLNLCLYALGREILFDPGRLTYSVPEYKSWTRQTVAHNTVALGGRSQRPDTGELLFFRADEALSAAYAVSRDAYDDADLKRFLLLTDQYLLDAFLVEARTDTTIDWLAHTHGTLSRRRPTEEQASKPLPAGFLGKREGYQHLEDLRLEPESDRYAFHAAEGDGPVLGMYLPLEAGSRQLVTGHGIGYRLQSRAPFLLRRREGRHALFLTLYTFPVLAEEAALRILPVTVGGEAVPAHQALALEIHQNGARSVLAIDLREKPTPAPAVGEMPFDRAAARSAPLAE